MAEIDRVCPAATNAATGITGGPKEALPSVSNKIGFYHLYEALDKPSMASHHLKTKEKEGMEERRKGVSYYYYFLKTKFLKN